MSQATRTHAPLPAPPNESTVARKQRTWVRDIVEILLIALVLYVIIWSALQTVRVDGFSMQNSLQNGDLLLASKISYKLGPPQRADIVVLIPPIDPSKDFIKRIIAVPGDVIEIDADNGTTPAKVLIKPGGSGDFQVLSEPYLPEPMLDQSSCCDSDGKQGTATPTPVTVPPDMYFVMGDNRNHSEDGRVFGFVARDKIIAKAFLRVWPFFHFGLGTGSTLVPALGAALPIWWLPRRLRRRRALRHGRLAD